MIYQCIINISEGRDNNVINSVADASEGICLDIHSDPDHHRSVLTLASNSLDETLSSAKAVSRAAIEQIEFESHEGVHPRVGAVDVVPFVSYDESGIKPNQETILAAKNFGTWINSEFDIEVYFYDMASNNETTLPEIRTNRDLSIAPDIPSALYYNRHGSVCVGAREPLLAINVNLDCNDLELAKTIAMQIRESSGGIKGVRAIGLELPKQKCVQVSMNIVDCLGTNVAEVCEIIRLKAQKYQAEVELVGLVPCFQFKKWSKSFLDWSDLSSEVTVEHRLDSLKD